LSVQEADLTSADADITGRHVRIRSDIFTKLRHEALAECHNLSVGFSLGIEVRSALAAADGQSGQRVFEDLLKAQELDDTQVYRRMETTSSLVRSDCAV